MSIYDMSYEYGVKSSLYDQLASGSDRLFILSGFQTYGSVRDMLLNGLFGHSWSLVR